MIWLTPQEFSASFFTDKFSIAHGNFSANGDDMRATFDFHSFK